ncbi:MCE family protein [Mycobacterium eburneum]|nr:MCE family protein [Mycobacterium eburneum]TDH52872.1 MCE family protein [Mycobacterium eburneum]
MTLSKPAVRRSLIVALVLCLVAGSWITLRAKDVVDRVHVVGYFANSNGVYPGDEVRVLGVPVGKIDKIEPLGRRVKISFWYDKVNPVPADAKAVILSPSLVSVRAIQLTPAYTGGPQLTDGATIPEQRTAVPIEWDDFRQQLQKLTQTLQPTQPGGVSTLGAFINTAADNLRGQGTNIRETLTQLSQAFSALGDHSSDLFSTVHNISVLVTALQSSTELMRNLNRNLDGVTGLLANGNNEVGGALSDISNAVDDVTNFISTNREALGTTSDKLASITTTLNESLDDFKQTLHVAPTAFQNFVNIYQPSQGALTGVLSANNFANPVSFICGAIQAASRLGAQQSAKLCAQYLAPIFKNRQYNFPPLGENLFVGQSARPNEITYSEDWMRPDYIPPAAPGPASAAPPPDPAGSPAGATPPLPAEAMPTEPSAGLAGMMAPPGTGS